MGPEFLRGLSINEILRSIGLNFVREISASDILNWSLAFVSGVIIFKIVDNMQTNINRHAIIKEIEITINSLFSSPLAKSNYKIDLKDDSKLAEVNVRTVLHSFTPWEYFDRSIEGEDKTMIEDTQRYIRIRSEDDCTEYISTQALHEILIVFRRIEKLFKDSILKKIDLADMWREILPFADSGRLLFLSSYFCKEDIEPISFVVFNTVLACEKYEMENALEGFRKLYVKEKKSFDEKIKKQNKIISKRNKKLNKEEKENIIEMTYENLFANNKRFRKREKLKVSKFNRIVKLKE